MIEIRDREVFMDVFRSTAPFEANTTWASVIKRARDWGFAHKTYKVPSYRIRLFHRSGLFVCAAETSTLECIQRRNSHRILIAELPPSRAMLSRASKPLAPIVGSNECVLLNPWDEVFGTDTLDEQ